MNRGYFVFQNNRGEVARTLMWEKGDLHIVYLEKSRRLDFVTSTIDLSRTKTSFLELGRAKKEEIQKTPHNIKNFGILKWVADIDQLTPQVETGLDTSSQTFNRVLIGTALLAFFMLLGLTFVRGVLPPEIREENVVEIIPKNVRALPMGAPSSKGDSAKVTKAADQFLGHLKAMSGSQGLNLNHMKTSSTGSGGPTSGVAQGFAGDGLVAVPMGGKARISGGPGYGTHGAAGGHPGYGNMSLVGSGSTIGFSGVKEGASVEGGGLDRDEIASVIEKHIGQIRACYEQGLQVKSDLNGRVAIRFFINGQGFVNKADINHSSLHARDIEQCMLNQLRSWKFPEPRGGVIVKVTYPFVLRRVSQS